MIVSLILGLVIGALSVLFAFQNVFPVTVTFLSWEITASLALLIGISVLTGLIIGALVSIPGAVANALTISGLKKENKRLQDELALADQKRQEAVVIAANAGERGGLY